MRKALILRRRNELQPVEAAPSGLRSWSSRVRLGVREVRGQVWLQSGCDWLVQRSLPVALTGVEPETSDSGCWLASQSHPARTGLSVSSHSLVSHSWGVGGWSLPRLAEPAPCFLLETAEPQNLQLQSHAPTLPTALAAAPAAWGAPGSTCSLLMHSGRWS